jgi:hypothetical protein
VDGICCAYTYEINTYKRLVGREHILRKYNVKVWTELIRIRTESHEESFEYSSEPLGSIKGEKLDHQRDYWFLKDSIPLHTATTKNSAGTGDYSFCL